MSHREKRAPAPEQQESASAIHVAESATSDLNRKPKDGTGSAHGRFRLDDPRELPLLVREQRVQVVVCDDRCEVAVALDETLPTLSFAIRSATSPIDSSGRDGTTFSRIRSDTVVAGRSEVLRLAVWH